MLEVHRDLLLDDVRTRAYRDAIRHFVTADSVVLDLGTGSGILGFFACEAGARRVFAVDATHSADLASFLTRQLGFADRMEVIHEHSTKIELPERANLLVTETLGSFAFNEQILSSVINARARLLRSDATIIPQRIDLYLVPVEAPEAFDRFVNWWKKEPFGFDFSPLSVFASNVMYAVNVDAASFLAEPGIVISTDLATVTSTDVSGHAHFNTSRAGTLCGFSGWFRATLAPGIEITNEIPNVTNWNHVFLPLESPLDVEAGTPIDVDLETSDGKSWRWRGQVGSARFDQMTLLSAPPCFDTRR
ncbi:MAG: 50S ribosomal protein L11 methyltransferase [Thermoanaerobaculia bacterium]